MSIGSGKGDSADNYLIVFISCSSFKAGFLIEILGRPGLCFFELALISFKDYFASLFSSLWSQFDNQVRLLDDIGVVFNDDNGGSFFLEFSEDLEEFFDIVEMESHRRLVQDVYGSLFHSGR